MNYSVEFKPDAIAALGKLTQAVAQRILNKIRWMSEHFDQLNPLPLTGDRSGLFKLRVGDCRVIYSFNRESKIITIHQIGHRREIYD